MYLLIYTKYVVEFYMARSYDFNLVLSHLPFITMNYIINLVCIVTINSTMPKKITTISAFVEEFKWSADFEATFGVNKTSIYV